MNNATIKFQEPRPEVDNDIVFVCEHKDKFPEHYMDKKNLTCRICKTKFSRLENVSRHLLNSLCVRFTKLKCEI